MSRNLFQIKCRSALTLQSDRHRNTVYDLIVPLVENGELPVARGNAGKVELPIAIALREGELLAIRISQTGIALREGVTITRAATVEPLIWCPAHACSGDKAFHLIGAGVGRSQAGANSRLAIVDDLRVGETNGDVVSRRPELLEIGRFSNPHKRIVSLLAVQSIGLQPLFAACNAVGVRRGYYTISALVEVVDYRLPGQWR